MRRRIKGQLDYPLRGGEYHNSSRRKIDSNVERVMLSRLKEKGFVVNEIRGLWKLTIQGVTRVRKILSGREQAVHVRSKPPSLIIAFDVPEVDARKRMLQKSVWFGPSPLPKDFAEELRLRHLLLYMKFFTARETDIV